VILPVPYWVSYPDVVKYANGKPVLLATSPEDGFCLRASEVEKRITPRTRMLIVNSPANPSGAVIPPDEFAHILDVCRRAGIWLVSDECYSHFVYGTIPFSVASLANSKDHVVVLGSLSKTFAMTGWRMGYVLAPAALMEAVQKLQSQSTSNPTSISQYAALEALTGPMNSVSEMLREYGRRRERILAGLRAIPGIECPTPQGAFYAFPNVSKTGLDSSAVAGNLLKEKYVAVVPGEAFGAANYIRISYAASMERIEEGLKRLSEFFAPVAASARV
jgi:aspartate aminotransferase